MKKAVGEADVCLLLFMVSEFECEFGETKNTIISSVSIAFEVILRYAILRFAVP